MQFSKFYFLIVVIDNLFVSNFSEGEIPSGLSKSGRIIYFAVCFVITTLAFCVLFKIIGSTINAVEETQLETAISIEFSKDLSASEQKDQLEAPSSEDILKGFYYAENGIEKMPEPIGLKARKHSRSKRQAIFENPLTTWYYVNFDKCYELEQNMMSSPVARPKRYLQNPPRQVYQMPRIRTLYPQQNRRVREANAEAIFSLLNERQEELYRCKKSAPNNPDCHVLQEQIAEIKQISDKMIVMNANLRNILNNGVPPSFQSTMPRQEIPHSIENEIEDSTRPHGESISDFRSGFNQDPVHPVHPVATSQANRIQEQSPGFYDEFARNGHQQWQNNGNRIENTPVTQNDRLIMNFRDGSNQITPVTGHQINHIYEQTPRFHEELAGNHHDKLSHYDRQPSVETMMHQRVRDKQLTRNDNHHIAIDTNFDRHDSRDKNIAPFKSIGSNGTYFKNFKYFIIHKQISSYLDIISIS